MEEIKRIGVLTSGGDAPGMNAAIRAVVRAGIHFDRVTASRMGVSAKNIDHMLLGFTEVLI